MLLDKKIPFSYVMAKVKYDLALLIVIGTLVYYIKQQLRYLLPDIPIAIPAFIGTAISVILSFKLSQSYDRWWEARKIWGSIVNDSRNLILQLQAFLPNDRREDLIAIGHRQIAWVYCLGRSLRGLDPLHGLERFVPASEMAHVNTHANKSLALLQLNSLHLRRLHEAGRLDNYSHVHANATLTNLSNYMGMAERIKSTVFPVTYRLFLHLFIYLFAITLSIALEDIALYFELPLLVMIATSFLLLEKSAKYLQDPFSNAPTDTAMTAIATTIEINIKQMLGESDVPQPHTPGSFYLM
jgi:ion channel-forming bestrophin family protein